MDLIKEFHKISTVKKATFNSVITQVHLKINTEKGHIQKEFITRSQSFKKVTKFVPTLKPKKSTFIPTPLKLDSQINEKEEEKDDFDKQKSDDEIQIIDDEDNSSFLSSSSELENSINENLKIDKDKEKEKDKDKEEKNRALFKMNSNNNLDNKESKDMDNNIVYEPIEINDIKDDDNKSMRLFRRKMSRLRAKAGLNKSKETEETININFKKSFHIDMKKIEKKYDSDLYHTFKIMDLYKNENTNQKVKTIFEVISISKKEI